MVLNYSVSFLFVFFLFKEKGGTNQAFKCRCSKIFFEIKFIVQDRHRVFVQTLFDCLNEAQIVNTRNLIG
jgi:hypothetical protein